jgi:hypothetical protein
MVDIDVGGIQVFHIKYNPPFQYGDDYDEEVVKGTRLVYLTLIGDRQYLVIGCRVQWFHCWINIDYQWQ